LSRSIWSRTFVASASSTWRSSATRERGLACDPARMVSEQRSRPHGLAQ
jgi:hypothetical protein